MNPAGRKAPQPAAGGISVHVVDTARGAPAKGMVVEIFALIPERRLLARGRITEKGVLRHPLARGTGVRAGLYEAVFHVGDYYRLRGHDLPEPPFLDLVPVRFGIARAREHFHLPLKVGPWGYSLWRGA